LAVGYRHFALMAAAVAVSGFAMLPATAARAAALPPWTTPSQPVWHLEVPRAPGQSGQSPAMTGCEQRLERARRAAGYSVPGLALCVASFTAGVGSGNPDKSWAALLARQLHWDAVIYGVPGAGYVRAGAGREGPVAAEIARAGLRALQPALVIVQAGHDDIGVRLELEQQRVERAVDVIHAEAPRARIALLTVFTGRSRPAAAYQTDHGIVTAATTADRTVIIMDPLAAGWTFPRARDGLHPTARGAAWIAGRVAGILRRDGVRPAEAPRRDGAGIVICDRSVRGRAG
jgi:lysophospholipase L1-like esterase